MIYRNSYFRKELRQAYIENSISTARKIIYAVFVGLVSFALHFFLRTMSDSILGETFPHLVQRSFSSTLYLYIASAYFLYTVYYIVYYDYLSFAEIIKNRWYLLSKMGYKPLSMIFAKILAFIYSVWVMYTVGFALVISLTLLVKYTFIYEYILAFYLAGLFDIIVIGIVAITSSLNIYDARLARKLIFLFTLALLVIKQVSGYYGVLTNRVLMRNAICLVDLNKSWYLLFCAVITLICILFSIFKANNVAKYYNLPEEDYHNLIPEGTKVFRIDDTLSEIYVVWPRKKSDAGNKIISAAVITLICLVILITLVFNVFVLISSATQLDREVSVLDHIAYIFQTETMEPAIMNNDFVLFRVVEQDEPINIGDIVLFQENNIVYAERVYAREGGNFLVDIDKYPSPEQEGAMKKSVPREEIYGIFVYRNRWLGLMILFANTIFGRLMLLLIPSVVLFFYIPIRNFVVNMMRYVRFQAGSIMDQQQ